MKRMVNLWLVTIFLLGATAVGSQAQTSTTTTTTMATAAQSSGGAPSTQPSTAATDQSLGDYARAVKKDKKPTSKTFDNDNLPMEDKLSVVGKTTAPASDAQQAAPNSANPALAGNGGDPSAADKADAKKMPTVTPGESQEDRQKVFGQWQDKLSEQKGKVDSLSQSIDVLQREYHLRVAEVYYDPTNRARNDATSDKQAADLKREIEEKQQALNDAKQDMDSLQEDARKAGVPESVRDNAGNQQK